MASALITNSSDLSRLRAEGYEVAVKSGYLVITNVPYLTAQRVVARGTLISALKLANSTTTARPDNHVVQFIGSHPCNLDGSEIQGLGRHGDPKQKLAEGLVADFSFSNKPEGGYTDFYEKMSRYVQVISAPVIAIDPSATARTGKVIESRTADSPFVYTDTNSSRAQITAISEKLKGQHIAIVGLGGTGSFVLDLVAKTPVKEIHLFDEDDFYLHNAFRSPGAPTRADLDTIPTKVAYYSAVYSRLHKGIVPHCENLNESSVARLQGFDFVFLCIDTSPEKKAVVNYLADHGIPFVDTGLGVQAADEKLVGIVRATTITRDKRNHIDARIPTVGKGADEYATNIQIAELNMLNGVMAVIRWKKLLGFYADYRHEHHCTYTIETNVLLSEEDRT